MTIWDIVVDAGCVLAGLIPVYLWGLRRGKRSTELKLPLWKQLYCCAGELDTEAVILVNTISVPEKSTALDRPLTELERVYEHRRKASNMLISAADLLRSAGDALAKSENIERIAKGSQT